MLTKSEFKTAVRNARQVMVYVKVTPDNGINLRISKAAAMDLVKHFSESEQISAIVSVDETTVWIG